MQLIEVAVVAAFREAGLALERIRIAREYVHKTLQSEYPFAEYRFKKEGKRLLLDYEQVEGKGGRGKFLDATQGGQLVWEQFVNPRLQEFVYDDGGVAIRWRVAGPKSPVIIDPRVSFGAPTIDGVPTWVIKGRWEAGESIPEIASDFAIRSSQSRRQTALKMSGNAVPRPHLWIHLTLSAQWAPIS